MAANALVQTRIDPAVKEKAATVLDGLGLTVSDAVRIMLTRTANEGALPFDLASNAVAHDRWFRARMQRIIGWHRGRQQCPTRGERVEEHRRPQAC